MAKKDNNMKFMTGYDHFETYEEALDQAKTNAASDHREHFIWQKLTSVQNEKPTNLTVKTVA